MKKFKAFFKRHWSRVVAIACAVVIATTATVTFAVTPAEIWAIIETILDCYEKVQTTIDFLSTNSNDDPVLTPNVSNSDDIVKQSNYYGLLYVACDMANINQSTFIEFYDYIYNQIFTTDYSDGTISYDQFEFCSDIYNFLYKAFTVYYITEEQWCRVLFDGDGKLVANSDYSVSDTGDVQISGKKFKQMVDYWHTYYLPKDQSSSSSRVYWTLKSDALPESFKSYTASLKLYMPLYCTSSSNNGFLGLGWSDLYMLPYSEYDATNKGYTDNYYGLNVWHFSIKRNEINEPFLYCEILSLEDGSVVSTFTAYEPTSSTHFSTHSNIKLRFEFTQNTYFGYVSKGYSSYLDMMGDFFETLDCHRYFSEFVSADTVATGSFDGLKRYRHYETRSSTGDIGFICQNEMFELWANDTSIDTSKIPDDYVVTPKGNTVYDYTITNNSGDTSTINNYITNNYVIPSDKKDDDQSGGSGGSSGTVNVSGDVNVRGDIDVSGKVDINVNVNQGNGENAGDYIDPGEIDSDLDGYLSHVPEVSKNFIDYLKDFFGWLPNEIYGLLVLGLVVCIFCRLNGR